MEPSDSELFHVFLKENLLDPEERVDTGDCYGNKGGNWRKDKNTSRRRRALEKAEEEEGEEGAGKKRQMWGSQS